MIKKLANIFEFYKSTLAINLAISALSWVFGGFDLFEIVLIFFGFFISVLIKEVNAKKEYLFYFNNGISKTELLLFSFLMNFIFSVTLIVVINFYCNLYD